MNGTTLVRYLGTDTFVSIPDTVKSIGDEAFSGNETMTSIEIPDSVTSIGYNAFKNCSALTGVSISDSVKKVGPGAFEGCKELTSVTIGENVSSWGTGVFTNCDTLAKVSIDSDNEYLTYYNGAIYNGNMTMLYQVLPGREGENYVMPDTVKNIDAYAFWNLINTKNVKVSSEVGSIPKYADIFGSNNNIDVIYKAEYPDDFMDSNPGLEEKPNVGESYEDTENTATDTTQTGEQTEENNRTEESSNLDQSTEEETTEQSSSSEFISTEGYIHPLDVPEKEKLSLLPEMQYF